MLQIQTTLSRSTAVIFLLIVCLQATPAQKAKPAVRAARRAIPEFQTDPLRLIKEFSLDAGKRQQAFNFKITAEDIFGAQTLAGLDEKQRARVAEAFNHTIKEFWEDWDEDAPLPDLVRVVHSEIKNDRASVVALHGETMLRFKLAQRGGAWFITDYEFTDDSLDELADALRGALHPETRRGNLLEIEPAVAIKQVDRLIAAEGETPELALLKVRLIALQQLQSALDKTQQQPPTLSTAQSEPIVKLLEKITTHWPDFAPAYLMLGRELLYSENSDVLNPLSKDVTSAVAALQRYAQLVPYDPRPHSDLANALDQTDNPVEAESQFLKAIELDLNFPEHYSALITFYLSHEEAGKAIQVFAQLLKVVSDPDDAFEQFVSEPGYDPDFASELEKLITAFPKELQVSASGQVLLAGLQEAQNKVGDAIKSMQRAIAIAPDAGSFEYLSELYRMQQRFAEALSAANQSLKYDALLVDAHFERACSLAQLGRKREALMALKKMFEIDPETTFNPDEPDLQPLASSPEFIALKEKMNGVPAPSGKGAVNAPGKVKGSHPKPQ